MRRAASDPIADDAAALTLTELARALALAPDWVVERVQAGLIEAGGVSAHASPAEWRFEAVVVRRVRSMWHTEHCYDAAPELAALVADLEDEIDALRRRVARLPR
ncbi:MAG: MerR family transcriptional regulator [Proteobacteria bacterium]|jgi:chaperone modulatory protein CbpM|nr:MerR family transcriptional regulator [Pseudomonadota bacterium]HOL38653.1 MerR family transcriptional regulator [Rubrivivax sp.]